MNGTNKIDVLKKLKSTPDPAAYGRSMTWEEIYVIIDEYADERFLRDEDYLEAKAKASDLRPTELTKREFLTLRDAIRSCRRHLKNSDHSIASQVLESYLNTNKNFIELQDVYGDCFIATAVYGSYDAPEVRVLRHFRDFNLRPYFFGRLLIDLYYLLGPVMARFTKRWPLVGRLARWLLNRFIYLL